MSRNDSLKDRLAKRRQLHNKNVVSGSSADESDVKTKNHRSTTQSLDRTSSQRTNPELSLTSHTASRISDEEYSPTPITTKNSEQPSMDNSFAEENYLAPVNQSHSTSVSQQSTKRQSFGSENVKKTPSKSLASEEQDILPVVLRIMSPKNAKTPDPGPEDAGKNSYSNHKKIFLTVTQDVSPVILRAIPSRNSARSDLVQEDNDTRPYSHRNEETISAIIPQMVSPASIRRSSSVQQEAHLHHGEDPIFTKEVSSPKIPPLMPSRWPETSTVFPEVTQKNSRSYSNEIYSSKLPPVAPPRIITTTNTHSQTSPGYLLPSPIKTLDQKSFEHPLTHPPTNHNNQRTYFNFPQVYPERLPRSKSDQLVSKNIPKHPRINPKFPKIDSLAYSYVFNRRMFDGEFDSEPSLDKKQSQQKTVWN